MSTEQDDHGIYHIDGPPVAGFTLAENPDGSGQSVRILYKTLCYIGTKEECKEAYEALMNLITSELQDLMEIQVNKWPGNGGPIIWWRKRVEYDQDPEDANRWKFYCRLDTSPPLPREFWDKWMKVEGEQAKNAREVIG